MRLTLDTMAAASGRLSGVVARPGKSATSLSAHTTRTQPRSASQSAGRHLTGSIASLWRSLTTPERAAWQAAAVDVTLASGPHTAPALTGYTLFMSCNRRLASLGFGYTLTWPGPATPVPGIATLEVIPTYTQPGAPQYLASLPLWIDPTIPAPFCAIVRASPALSAAKAHTRRSDLRSIGVMVPYPTFTVDTLPLWLAIYGTIPPVGAITYEVQLIDPRSGLVGAPRRTRASFASLSVPDYSAGTVTVAFGGTDQAAIDDTVISFGGVPVAGGQ